jgi:LEA14-like dessication related protein
MLEISQTHANFIIKIISMRNLLVAGIVGGIGYGIYRIAQNSGKLQYGQAKLQSTKYQFPTAVIFHLVLPIANPTSTNFPFKGITGGAFYGAVKIADIQLDTTQKIVLKSTKTVNVPVKVTVELLKLTNDVRELIKSGNWLNAAKLKGTIISDLKFPFEVKIF